MLLSIYYRYVSALELPSISLKIMVCRIVLYCATLVVSLTCVCVCVLRSSRVDTEPRDHVTKSCANLGRILPTTLLYHNGVHWALC